MVQLKEQKRFSVFTNSSLFQFLMVQLKAIIVIHSLKVQPISIPNGSIKSYVSTD